MARGRMPRRSIGDAAAVRAAAGDSTLIPVLMELCVPLGEEEILDLSLHLRGFHLDIRGIPELAENLPLGRCAADLEIAGDLISDLCERCDMARSHALFANDEILGG